jgi:hypothetical protein
MSTNDPMDVHQYEERFQTELPLTTMLMEQNRLISTEKSGNRDRVRGIR